MSSIQKCCKQQTLKWRKITLVLRKWSTKLIQKESKASYLYYNKVEGTDWIGKQFNFQKEYFCTHLVRIFKWGHHLDFAWKNGKLKSCHRRQYHIWIDLNMIALKGTIRDYFYTTSWASKNALVACFLVAPPG